MSDQTRVPAPGPDVALVCMPNASVQRPSIALGQLKAALTRDGLSAKVLYPNLMFLDFVGIQSFGVLGDVRPEDQLVEWMFGRAAFPDFAPDHGHFLRRLLERNHQLSRHDPERLFERLRELRDRMPDFVEWAADKVLETRPRIVGATSTFQQHVASLALLRTIKARAPEIVTMMGGANCETVMGQTTHAAFPWVDYVVSGEADEFFARLCTAILRDGIDVTAADLPFGTFGPIHRLEGYPRTEDGDGLPRAVTADVNDIPVPDYDDYFEALDDCLHRNHIRPGLPFETSRGCWWGAKQHCTFCGLNGGGMTFRAKDPARALADIETLVARHGIKNLEAVDNIIDVTYLSSFLPRLVKADRDLTLFYETKANLKPAQVRALAESGVRWIQPGIESLDSNVLALMRKGVKAWNNVRLLRLARQHGVRLAWSILSGFPGEEDGWYVQMAKLLPLIAHLQPGGYVNLRYDRYSPYFNQQEQFGLRLRPSELYRFVYPLPPAQLENQVYFFEEAGSFDPARNLLFAGELDRPGLESVRHAVETWRTEWRSETPPSLAIQEGSDGRIVADTRRCAVAPIHDLSAAAAQVLEACEDGPPRHRLASHLEALPAQTVEDALAELIRWKLVVDIDDRLLSLPVRAPVPSLLKEGEFPGGYNFVPRIPITAPQTARPAVQNAAE